MKPEEGSLDYSILMSDAMNSAIEAFAKEILNDRKKLKRYIRQLNDLGQRFSGAEVYGGTRIYMTTNPHEQKKLLALYAVGEWMLAKKRRRLRKSPPATRAALRRRQDELRAFLNISVVDMLGQLADA